TDCAAPERARTRHLRQRCRARRGTRRKQQTRRRDNQHSDTTQSVLRNHRLPLSAVPCPLRTETVREAPRLLEGMSTPPSPARQGAEGVHIELADGTPVELLCLRETCAPHQRGTGENACDKGCVSRLRT